jgi:hypothetical protein
MRRAQVRESGMIADTAIRSFARAVIALLFCGLIIAAAAAPPARAGEGTVGGVALKLPPPQNFCDLDPKITGDARLLNGINGMLGGTGNRLLAASADCTELTDWRSGQRKLLDNLAQYQTLVSQENNDVSTTGSAIVKAACAQMRGAGEKMVADMAPGIKARAEAVMKTIELNEQKFLGVIDEEPDICYAALLQKFKAETGENKTQVTVFATTFLASRLMYIYLFAPYHDGEAVTELLARQKTLVTGLRQLNAK